MLIAAQNSWPSTEDTGDNGVHASASPFEALAERSNWLRASVSKDAFGKALLASGIPLPLLTKEWFHGETEGSLTCCLYPGDDQPHQNFIWTRKI